MNNTAMTNNMTNANNTMTADKVMMLSEIASKRIMDFIKSPLYTESLKLKILDIIIPEFEFQIKINSSYVYDTENWIHFVDTVFRMIKHSICEFDTITITKNGKIEFVLVYDETNIEIIIDMVKVIFNHFNAYIGMINDENNVYFEWSSNGVKYSCTIDKTT
jgi:hypothetical protein